MKLLGRNNDEGGDTPAVASADAEQVTPSGTTAPKGRPTPRRTDRRRGPVSPAPMTGAEARQRRREMRKTMTAEERREAKAAERAALGARRERMLAGEEAFLLPRDKGPVRRYARDIVDSRRNFLGLFMPAAIVMIFVMMLLPRVQLIISPLMLLFMLVMGIDAIFLARKVNRAVDARFPDNTETHVRLGLYAASRASQIRRLRIPRPQVSPGTKVD